MAKILVAEDEDQIRHDVGLLLRRAGHLVHLLPNGERALEYFQHALETGEPYELVLTDFNMGEMTGVELANRIQTLCTAKGAAEVPIILASADPSQVKEEEHSLFASVLAKPIIPYQKLLDEIARLLQK